MIAIQGKNYFLVASLFTCLARANAKLSSGILSVIVDQLQ